MNIEQLKAQLAAGTITKDQYLAELKKLLDATTITQEEHDAAATYEPGNGGGALTAEEIQKMIQSEADKVRTKAAAREKALQDELDKLKTDKMSAEDKAKFEQEKLMNDLKVREAQLLKREVELHTVDQLRSSELPLDFRNILAGSTVEETDANIKTFKSQWDAAINAAVEAKFKENGSDPGKAGGSATTVKNPWLSDSFNLTQQAKILRENPAQAKEFMAAAGV